MIVSYFTQEHIMSLIYLLDYITINYEIGNYNQKSPSELNLIITDEALLHLTCLSYRYKCVTKNYMCMNEIHAVSIFL